jgi:hypothetical protein
MNDDYCTCEEPMIWHDGRDLCCERCDKPLSEDDQETRGWWARHGGNDRM